MKDLKKDVLATGQFAEFYTLNTFVRVYTAFGIDKVKMSFVTKGQHGQGCDMYVDTDVFDILCDDILSGDLRKLIAASKPNDKGYYPVVWEHVTGKDGSKKVNIARGMKKPVVITGYDGTQKKYIRVTVEKYAELRIMAKWWKRVSAPYYQKLAMIGYEAKKAFVPKYNPDDLEEPENMSDNEPDLPPVPPMA